MSNKNKSQKNSQFNMKETVDMNVSNSNDSIIETPQPTEDERLAAEDLEAERQEVEEAKKEAELAVKKEIELKKEAELAAKIKEDKVMNNENQDTEFDKQFEELMHKQDAIQKKLEKEKGGETTIDDTVDRINRSEEVATSGKRKGKPFKPNPGVANFMMLQNAKYKSSGKPAPYSRSCIKETLKKEIKA